MKMISVFIILIFLAACNPSNKTMGCIERPDLIKNSRQLHVFIHREKKDSNVPEKRSVKVHSSYAKEVQKFQVRPQRYTIDSRNDNEIIVGKRGTILHIPKRSLVDKSGNPYLGEANIHFKEFTNSAEIAFSNIPMMYRSGKEELRFNSAGMFEITATSSTGDEIYIGKDKSISVDYKLVKKNPNTDFYKLDTKKNTWTKVSIIASKSQKDTLVYTESLFIWENDKKWKLEKYTGDSSILYSKQVDYIDGGHTYPDIVKGLTVNRFGIYNCDQVYRLANQIKVNAKYIDATTGEPLSDLQTLSLIDLDYTGAFSFDPRQFICDSKGRNVLLLFDGSGNLYYLSEKSFQSLQLEDDGEYAFRMINISNRVKSTEDLQKLLNL